MAGMALVQRIAIAAGLATLLVAVVGILGAARRPAATPPVPAGRRLPAWALVAMSAAFAAVMVGLWVPLPISLPAAAEGVVTLLGASVYLAGLALYLWGRFGLGRMFAASTGAAAHLPVQPKLITYGPYAWVRHPMYLAVFLVATGGLLLFQTWSMLLLLAIAAALPRRAGREERLLAAQFGEAWTDYARRVPKWLPRLRG
jgi:protein-S-isoprenylcysteine O-methyltransferase Ste14